MRFARDCIGVSSTWRSWSCMVIKVNDLDIGYGGDVTVKDDIAELAEVADVSNMASDDVTCDVADDSDTASDNVAACFFFSYLVTIMGLTIPWSFILAIVDGCSVLVKCHIQQRGILLIIVLGDWVLSALTLAAACSTASVVDLLLHSDGSYCPPKFCSRYQISAAMAFLSWFLFISFQSLVTPIFVIFHALFKEKKIVIGLGQHNLNIKSSKVICGKHIISSKMIQAR
ncbi:hypothetical protein SADUNF_Sadunf04G0105800 [Salix dunnii]|uniref:CASP-like protein n=1 Tax=Salix dunnii TaxID=1413687 RepID=A0A835K986_9ROSI|nr:hypothetical protein SADUNF_Sadunf04G0105800 [Salix dunnii]